MRADPAARRRRHDRRFDRPNDSLAASNRHRRRERSGNVLLPLSPGPRSRPKMRWPSPDSSFAAWLENFVACSTELADYAEKLGELADRIAKADPLLPRLRVFQEALRYPATTPAPWLPAFRQRTADQTGGRHESEAAVSSRQEIYPRNMEAERALRLGIGALSGLGLGMRTKVSRLIRFGPSQQPLSRGSAVPDRSQRTRVDASTRSASTCSGNRDTRVFRRREAKILVTSGSSVGRRRSTATSTRHIDSTAPETVQAQSR